MKIQVSYLRAMLLFCAKQDIRYYLNGIAIHGDKMISTDGHRMTVCKLESDSGLNVIIPSGVLSVALQLHSMLYKKTTSIEVTNEKIGDVSYKPIDGQYPDWTKVVPEKFENSNEIISINPSFMSDFYSLIKLAAPKYQKSYSISILAKDSKSAVIVHAHGCDDFFCVVMPMRCENVQLFPNWIQQYKLPTL